MKKLNITKEQFNRSRYFKDKYGELEYVSESGKLFKTNKGNVLKFNEVGGIRRSGKKTLVGFDDDNWLGIRGAVDDGDVIIYKGHEVSKDDLYSYLAEDFPEFSELENDADDEKWLRAHKKEVTEMLKEMYWAYDESTKKFGKKFNEGRLARKLNSGELFEKQMPALGKAIQKFIDSDGRKGQAGTWNIVSDDDGSIKLYEHYGYWFGTIVDGHLKWKDEDGFYVSARYSEMILNTLCDGGLIERDECQRAIEDAYAREEEYEREYGESTKRFVKEARGPEWLKSFKQAQGFVYKACEQLEVAAFEGGADVGNPIHKKLLSIWGEMRDIVESV